MITCSDPLREKPKEKKILIFGYKCMHRYRSINTNMHVLTDKNGVEKLINLRDKVGEKHQT